MAKSLSITVAAAAASLMMVSAASATEGYFQHGYGARQAAMAGAGVADATDAMALSLNPAGIVGDEDQFTVGVTLFSPRRGFTVRPNPGFLPAGETESDSEYFFIPNIGYTHQIDERSAFSIAIYGNGGMNTDYPAVPRDVLECGGGNGIFCGGSAGVDFSQAFITVGYARELTDRFTVGVAPIIVYQMFEAKGLVAFSGLSADPAHLTNNEHDDAWGVGVRVGAEFDLTDNVRLGGSYQSVVNMSEFGDYAGLFEGQGNMDVPSSWQLGLSFDVSPELTVSADWRRVNYTDVDAVGNSTSIMAPFGSSGGPGFGWDDVDAFKIGLEYDAGGPLTLRAGVGFNSNPLDSEDVTLNVLAPGVMEQHYTAGFTWATGPRDGIDFAFMYAPEATVSGPEITPLGPTGNTVELNMHQFAFTVGWTHTFGN